MDCVWRIIKDIKLKNVRNVVIKIKCINFMS